MQCFYEGAVKRNSVEYEKIGLKPGLTLETVTNRAWAGVPFPSPEAKISKQDAHGYVYFDREAGKMVELKCVQSWEVAFESISERMEINTTMKLVK
jgi:hypothetical protein